MATDPAIVWKVLRSWPASVHICDIEGISHPLTPESVRQFYKNSIKNLEVVVWIDKTTDLLGLKAGISEHVWKTTEIKKVSLLFARPAKGGGYILFSVNKTDNTKESVANSDYSDSTLTWFRSIIEAMNDLYPLEIDEEDCGYSG